MWNNSDKFDHLISLAAMKCIEEEAQALNDLDTSDVVFDASYYRKRAKIINKYKRRPAMKMTKAIAIRVVAAVMIIVMLACVLIGCVPGLRKAIYDAIVKWHNEYFAIRYESPSGQERETAYVEEFVSETEAELVAPTKILEVRKPADLPEGVWEDVLLECDAKINIDYYFNEEYLFSFSQSILDPFDQYVDNEDVDVMYVDINGSHATIVAYMGQSEICILWNDKEYAYQITSNTLDIEKLIQYAESVK